MENFSFYKADLSNFAELSSVFDVTKPTVVVNLAAQAGVRYSLENPMLTVKVIWLDLATY